jgi:tetratricopeptide (TPR) repeat protein
VMSFGRRFGALVRRKRGEQAWSQENLAEAALGDPARKGMISQLENGRVRNPQQRTVERIAEALAISDEEVDACRSVSEQSTPRTVQTISKPSENMAELQKKGEIQQNLGLALMERSRLTNDSQTLQEAIEAFRNALSHTTRENAARQWATTQNNLGLALMEWSRLTDDLQTLQEAIEAFRNALSHTTRENAARQWATTQNNLGLALMEWSRLADDPQTLQEAIEAFRMASDDW